MHRWGGVVPPLEMGNSRISPGASCECIHCGLRVYVTVDTDAGEAGIRGQEAPSEDLFRRRREGLSGPPLRPLIAIEPVKFHEMLYRLLSGDPLQV